MRELLFICYILCVLCVCYSPRILRSSISETTPPPSRHLQASLVHHVLREVVGYLASKDCPCRRPLDHSCVGALVNFVETVLATRSSCCWTVGSLRHVAVLTVKAFALALPSDLQHGSIRHEPLRMLAVAGQPTSESQLVEGVLVEAADIFSNDISVEAIPRRGKNGEIVTAIFTVSLAGDVGGLCVGGEGGWGQMGGWVGGYSRWKVKRV